MKNLISIALIVIAVALGILVVKPGYDNISALRAEKATYDSTLANAKQLTSVRDALSQSYDSISDTDKAKLALILPSTFDPVKLTSDLANAAAVQGMSVSKVQVTDTNAVDPGRAGVVGAGSTGDTVETYSISLSTAGSYASFLQFLRTLESDTELLDLRQLSVKQGTTGQLSFDISFDTYAIGKPAPATQPIPLAGN